MAEGIDIPKAEGDQASFGSERERMDNTLLMALKIGDEGFVKRVFSPVTQASVAADHALVIDPHDADNVTYQAARRSWRGVTNGGNSALHIVASFGHLKLAELICARDSSLLEARNAALETPLHCAARAGADRIVLHFISEARRWEDGPRLEAVLRAIDREGRTALHAAAEERREEVAKVLLAEDPGMAAIVDSNGASPLYAAVLSESLEVVQILIESRADGEDTPEAFYAGPNGQTALHAAANVQRRGIDDKLLNWKPTLAKKVDVWGRTFLHYLAGTPWTNERTNKVHQLYDTTNMVRQLLKCDTSTVYISDREGYFPIHVAATKGRYDITNELIDRCNDMDELVDNEGRNFFHIAVLFNQPKIVELVFRHPLLAKMMNTRDSNGNTPLHLAISAKNQKMVSLLLGNKRVDHSIVDKDGKTPLYLAITQMDPGLVGILDPQNWIIQCLRRIGARSKTQRRDPLINHNDIEPDPKKELEKYESTTQNLIIASALIATVTFAAAFTMPGDYKADDHQDGGTPTLTRKYAFKAFIISDVLAFLCSIIATTWLLHAGSGAIDPSRRANFILLSIPFIKIAVQSMIVAFALSVYVVLAPVSIAIGAIVCVLAFLSPLLFDTELCQRLYLERTVKSRLGWSGVNISLAIFETIWIYLLLYIVFFSLFHFIKD